MLKFADVWKSYGNLTAVAGLFLEVRRGEIFGLLGPNGAGKSTTVHMAVGVLAPDKGTVTVDALGTPSLPDVRVRIGVAPQAISLYESLTGEENLAFFGRMYRLHGARLRARINSALQFVGLTDRKRDLIKTYSGGMKRRLNLAAAVLHEPELILLDEPSVGVDPQSRNLIFENILQLRSQGRTIVYTTHYMEEAERLCDRVGIMDHGKLLAVGTVPELLAQRGSKPELVVETNGKEVRLETEDPLGELNRLAAAGPVANFRLERPTLEQVFLNLTGRKLRD
jgi:ABC-2 type transport system ATP-binding protein